MKFVHRIFIILILSSLVTATAKNSLAEFLAFSARASFSDQAEFTEQALSLELLVIGARPLLSPPPKAIFMSQLAGLVKAQWTAWDYHRAAHEQFKKMQLDYGFAIVVDGLRRFPNHAALYVKLAELYIGLDRMEPPDSKRNRLQDAIAAANWARELDPQSPFPLHILANVYHKLGDYASAILYREENLRAHGSLVLGYERFRMEYKGRLEQLRAGHQIALANDLAHRYVSNFPTDPAAYGLLASLYYDDHEWDQAILNFRKALALGAPDDFITHLRIASALVALNREEEALLHARKALNFGADQPKALNVLLSILVALANSSLASGNLDSAIAYLEEARTLKPEDSTVASLREQTNRLLFAHRRLEALQLSLQGVRERLQALKLISDLVRDDAKTFENYLVQITIYQRIKSPLNAMQIVDDVIRLFSIDSDAIDALVQTLRSLGYTRKAQDIERRAHHSLERVASRTGA